MRVSQRLQTSAKSLLALIVLTPPATLSATETTVRFYQGVAAYINNPTGEAFNVGLEVRDWNLMENGPREMLFKIYDPAGKVLTRQIIEDDGVSGSPYLPETGGWDHEMWYYSLLYGRGSRPMIRWSSFTDPGRLQNQRARTFSETVSAGAKGIYRIILVGSRDHVATLNISPDLNFALGGHPVWMHGHGDMFRKSYVYVPKKTLGLNIAFAEFDLPVTRHFKVTGPNGMQLWDAKADGGFRKSKVKLVDGEFDDQVMTVEVGPGSGDFMMHLQLSRTDMRPYRGMGGVPALFASDRDTAIAVKGGAIYQDDDVFWHPFQVRYHDWVKKLEPEAFIVKDKDGKEIKPSQGPAYGWGKRSLVYKGLPTRSGFVPMNGKHEAPPISDSLMHSYPAHKNPNVLNLALRDLERGFRPITVGDCQVSGFNGNFGYIFASYGWHYWRPAWRILQQSDAPKEVKDIIREGMILCGDRLAFGRGIERVNGNAFSHIPMSLHYAAEATADPMQRQLARTYFDRFSTEGWGRGTGISKSGDSQEHFAHDFHYGSYILSNYRAITSDMEVPHFKKVLDRITNLYTYLQCSDTNAFPWCARTAHHASGLSRLLPEFKHNPGPEFTVSVNDGDEWFAARRKNYYALTFHGKLAPTWLNNYFATRIGYGGGAICQITVPGHGTVIASRQHGSYGKNMQPSKWRDFRIHSVVGEMASGQPLVAADCEHLDAKLDGTTVTGGGEVRDRPLYASRSYTFGESDISCSVALADTHLRSAYWGMGQSSKIREAWEMVPFVESHQVNDKKVLTKVTVFDEAGKLVGDLTDELVSAKSVRVDCSGYGVTIELPAAMKVRRGTKDTVMIQLIDKPSKPETVSLSYRIVPYIGQP